MKHLRRPSRHRRLPGRLLRVAGLGVALLLLAGWAAWPGTANAVAGTAALLSLPTRVAGTPTTQGVLLQHKATPPPAATPSAANSPASAATTPPPTPSRTIQSMVDAAAPGSVVVVPPGIYRETVTITKPITLVGEPGAEIRGSDVWTGWTKVGAYWVRGTVPAFPASNAPCLPASNGRCDWPEQVFLDGKPLEQVAANPVSGQFAIDSAREVVLANDPGGHTVEVTTRQAWIVGGADDVTIEGFTMRDAASSPQRGAIENDGHANWTIEDNTLSDAAGADVFLNGAAGIQVLDNDIARGGQEGLSLDKTTGAIVRGNTVHDNNTELFDTAWEAGGAKITRSTDLTVDGNTFSRNFGAGLWLDMGCDRVTVSDNRADHNARTGIAFEVSHDGTITNNAVWENGWDKPASWGAAGIFVNSSDHTLVSGNVVAWNVSGITVLSEQRSDARPVVDISIQDNTIAASDAFSPGNRYALRWLEDYRGPLYLAGANNHGANDRYWYPTTTATAARFHWTADLSQLAAFDQTPGEHGGVYISAAQLDQTLRAAGVPTSQEQH